MPATLLTAALILPSTGAGHEVAEGLIRQQTGQSVNQQEILRRIQESGMSREQLRQRLQRQGYDPALADSYFDRIEGGGGLGDLPPLDPEFIQVVNQAALEQMGVQDTARTEPLAEMPEPSGDVVQRRGRVRVSHILLALPRPAYRTQRDSVRRLAHELHLRLLGGADFARVARLTSDDSYSAPRGGDLGWLEAGQMPEAFEAVAFSIEPGRVSRPVETPSGFHLIRVDDREVLEVFGRKVFSRPSSQFQPVTTGPVDSDYRLGPGDQLLLVLTGDVELAYTLEVTREGYVVIPDVGQVSVHGLTLEELNDRLYARLGDVYSGVRRGADATTRFDVSLGRLRRNLVYVIGDVTSPGAYQVSGVATVFHALHRAGGPTAEGSFRDVRVRRAGRERARIDLYRYLVEGDANQDVRLEQGDIVFVPPAGPQVTIRGRIKRPATYELREGEGLSDLLQFAGGLRPDAYPGRVQIDRILPPEQRTPEKERVMLDVSVEGVRSGSRSVALREGDRVAVFGISDERWNWVRILGDVNRPGEYEYLDEETVQGLIRRAGGLRPSAYVRIAHVRRPDLADGGYDLLQVGLAAADALDLPRDLALEDRDEVVVFSVDSLNAADSVSITGPVQEPGRYVLTRGMTVPDLILMAGGFERGANPYRAEIVRRRITVDRADTLVTRTHVVVEDRIPYSGDSLPDRSAFDLAGLMPAAQVPLASDDRVIVRELPGYSPVNAVRLVGEVRNPGWYVMETRDETVTDLIAQAGGPTEEAYLDGFRLIRESVPVGVDLSEALENPHGSEDLPVEPGDSLILPSFDPTVRIEGAVAFDARVRYREGWGLNDYLEQAGGTLENADDGRISVEYANGARAVVNQRRFFFDSKPDVRPGSAIFVPEAPPGVAGFNLGQALTRTTSILSATAALLIAVTRF